MKKLFVLMTAVLLMLTACQSAETESDNADDGSDMSHQGESLTDYIQTLSINGKEFPFPATFDEMREIFGDDMKTRYPDYPGSVLDRQDGTYWIVGEYAFDGYFWGRINFITEDENGENAVLDWFSPDFLTPSFDDFEDDGIREVSYWKDGGMVTEQFVYEEGRIPCSLNGFTPGAATRTEIQDYFGEVSSNDMGKVVTTDNYVFEDYILTLYYGEHTDPNLLTRFMITSNYADAQ